MPVTAKLSRKFYERLGDDVANELVEWFNQVDAAYRSEFRDLFEVHFARFDQTRDQIRRARSTARQMDVPLRVGTLGTLIALQRLH